MEIKLTKKEAVKLHRELWGWLAENPMKKKEDWPEMDKYKPLFCECFPCQYIRKQQEKECDECLFIWPDPTKHTDDALCQYSLFGKWTAATKPEERSKYAALIRDLPEKKVEPKSKFSIDDKVVPVSKTAITVNGAKLTSLECDKHWREAKEQGFMYIVGLREELYEINGQFCYMLSERKGGTGNFYTESDLIPYVEPVKNKLKVGDIVAGNAKSNGRYNWTNTLMTKGEVVKILRDGDISIKVLEHENPIPIGNTYDVEEKYFELVTEEPKKETPFRVGDRVKVVAHDRPGAIGKIGVIKFIYTDHCPYGVVFDENVGGGTLSLSDSDLCDPEYGLWMRCEELELIPETETERKIASLEKRLESLCDRVATLERKGK